MGGLMSNPLDEETKREIEEIIKNVLARFTLEYTKAYALAIIYKAKIDAMEPPSDYRLEKRPEEVKIDKHSGYLNRENTGFVKGWKKQFFVIKHDYLIDIFVDESRAKHWRTVSPSGYNVIDDVNNGVLLRLKHLAEKMGLDVSALPKPKEYPPFTLELHHNRRQSYFLTAENEEEFRKWVRSFQTACWLAYGLKNKEFVHKRAFNRAVEKTREHLGRWGWWGWGGVEEEILSDLIVDELQWVVMDKVYGKIQGPWAVRNKVYGVVQKVLDKTVMGAVTPAWKAMSSAVDALRPKIEPALKEVGTEIGKLEAELIAKLKDGAIAIIEPAINEIKPHLVKPVAFLSEPLKEAYAEAIHIFEEATAAEFNLADEAVVKKEFERLDYIPHSWAIWRATDKIDQYYDPLSDLRLVFKDIYPWSIIWKAKDHVRIRTDTAIYTFEKRLEETKANPGAHARARESVLADFEHDTHVATRHVVEELIKLIIMPGINATIRPAAKALLEPLDSTIPDAMKDFVDVNELFDRVLDDTIHEALDRAIKAH